MPHSNGRAGARRLFPVPGTVNSGVTNRPPAPLASASGGASTVLRAPGGARHAHKSVTDSPQISDVQRGKLERSAVDDDRGGPDLREDGLEVDTTMGRRERPQAPFGLHQLPLAADPVATAGLVPRDGHVHEALEEVLFRRVGRPPRVFERLVRLEVGAVAHQPEPAGEVVRQGRRTCTSSPATRTSYVGSSIAWSKSLRPLRTS